MKTILFENKYKIIKQTAFCRKWNRDYAACIIHAVHFLVA